MLLFIPLMAGAIYLLLRGIPGTAAKVARIPLIPFGVFYSAWETLQGIANGVLIDKVNALPDAERGVGAELFRTSPRARLSETWASSAPRQPRARSSRSSRPAWRSRGRPERRRRSRCCSGSPDS